MSKRLRSFLAVMIPVLLGVFVMTALLRLYVVPLVFNDTAGFMRAALWSYDMTAYRTPLYGWLLIAATHTVLAMLPVWFQIFCWLLCVAAFATLVLRLTGGPVRTVLFGTLFVLIETAVMYSPASQWILLSDPLYADAVMLGLCLMLIGTLSKQHKTLWIGAGGVGASCLLRPVLAPLVPAVIILLHGQPLRMAFRSRRFLGGLAIMFLPIVVLSAANAFMADTVGLSPIGGLNMSYYTRALLTPEDTVFDDPELDRAFHLVVTKSELDPKYAGIDPFYLTSYRWWHPVFRFFGSLSPTTNHAAKRFEVSAESARIAIYLISRHPAEYTKLMVSTLLRTMIPTRGHRNFYFMRTNPFIFENLLGYSWQSPEGFQWTMSDDYADPYARDMRVGQWIDAERYGIRLPQDVGPKTRLLLVLFTVLALTESVGRLRSPEKKLQILGLAILACIAHTYLNALAVALVTLHDDPRYGLPGIMTGSAACVLLLLSLGMRVESWRRKSPTH